MTKTSNQADPKRAKKKATPTLKKVAGELRAPKPRGLAALSPERRSEIAAMGGRSVQATGTGNRFTPKQAAVAGKKGGRAVSKNRKHMAKIGRKGGKQASKDTP